MTVNDGTRLAETIANRLDYVTVNDWTRLADTIANRVDVLNQCLGARYASGADNPVKVYYKYGWYRCGVCGVDFCKWRIYDVVGTSDALARIDALCDGLWYMMRADLLHVHKITTNIVA